MESTKESKDSQESTHDSTEESYLKTTKEEPKDADQDSIDSIDSVSPPPTIPPFEDNPSSNLYSVGFSEDRNKRYRRSMEDAHVQIYNFGSTGSAFFAIYDGHAGKSTAEYCSLNLHTNFLALKNDNPSLEIPQLLSMAFCLTDKQLSEKKGLFSGSTAVVALVNFETRIINGIEQSVQVLYTANAGDSRAVLWYFQLIQS